MAALSSQGYRAASRSTHTLGLAAVIALHVAVLFLLLQLESVRSAITAAIPITVDLIPPPKVVLPQIVPKPAPVKPKVVKPRPVPTPPVVKPAPEPPAVLAAPTPPIIPAPVAPPEPVVVAPPAPDVAPAPAPPAPVTPPSFNAAYLNNPPPVYPALSRRMGEAGKVVLKVFVSEQGLPTQVEMRTSSGHASLDEAAMNTVRQWRFVPARRGDTPVSAWVLVPITFALRS